MVLLLTTAWPRTCCQLCPLALAGGAPGVGSWWQPTEDGGEGCWAG